MLRCGWKEEAARNCAPLRRHRAEKPSNRSGLRLRRRAGDLTRPLSFSAAWSSFQVVQIDAAVARDRTRTVARTSAKCSGCARTAAQMLLYHRLLFGRAVPHLVLVTYYTRLCCSHRQVSRGGCTISTNRNCGNDKCDQCCAVIILVRDLRLHRCSCMWRSYNAW